MPRKFEGKPKLDSEDLVTIPLSLVEPLLALAHYKLAEFESLQRHADENDVPLDYSDEIGAFTEIVDALSEI